MHQIEAFLASLEECQRGRPWAPQVVCDVLNALGAGFSLKFIDLFLKAFDSFEFVWCMLWCCVCLFQEALSPSLTGKQEVNIVLNIDMFCESTGFVLHRLQWLQWTIWIHMKQGWWELQTTSKELESRVEATERSAGLCTPCLKSVHVFLGHKTIDLSDHQVDYGVSPAGSWWLKAEREREIGISWHYMARDSVDAVGRLVAQFGRWLVWKSYFSISQKERGNTYINYQYMYFCNTQCKALKTSDYIQICTVLCSFVLLGGVFMVAFLQNILGAWLTPFAKKLLATWLERQYPAPKVKLSNCQTVKLKWSLQGSEFNTLLQEEPGAPRSSFDSAHLLAPSEQICRIRHVSLEGWTQARRVQSKVRSRAFAALNRVQMSLVFVNNSVCQHIVQCTECEARGSSSIGGNKQLQYKRWSLVYIYTYYIYYIYTHHYAEYTHYYTLACNALQFTSHVWGVSVEPGIAFPWARVHAGYAFMGGDSIYRPHAVLELMHQSIQSSTADQLSASREDCNIHDQSSVARGCHLPSSARVYWRI